MGSAWLVLFHFDAHTRPISPTYCWCSLCTNCIMATVTPIQCSLIIWATVLLVFFFVANLNKYIEPYMCKIMIVICMCLYIISCNWYSPKSSMFSKFCDRTYTTNLSSQYETIISSSFQC